MVRDQLPCLSMLQVISTCLLLSACIKTDDMICYSEIPVSCLVDLILPVLHYGCRRGDEKKVCLERWCVFCVEFLVASFNCNLPLWVLCPLWHEISTSQGPDWLWLTDLIWASVKQKTCFYLRVSACVCVNLSAQIYQRKQMQSVNFGGFSSKCVQGCSDCR